MGTKKGSMLTPDSFDHWLHTLEMVLPVVAIVVGSVAAILAGAFLALNLLDIRRLARLKAVFIELTPPATNDKSAAATQRLFSVLHGMEGSRSLIDKLLRRRVAFAAEIVATRETGIRYILRVPEQDAGSYEHIIASYLPEAKYRRTANYLEGRPDMRRSKLLSFRQSGHFAYPLHTQSELDDHDPVGYINGAMTQLEPGELMIFQLVLSPIRSKEALIIQNRLTHNEALVTQLGRRRSFVGTLLSAISWALMGIVDIVGDIFHGPSRSYHPQYGAAARRQEVSAKVKPARTLSAIEQELADSVNQKLSRPLFAVDMRALVVMRDQARAKQRAKDIRSALAAFKLPKYQSLVARLELPLRGRYWFAMLVRRLPSIFQRHAMLLSDAEVAGIYHFPNSQTGKTENVAKSLSKTLPAPVSLKRGTKPDVIIGRNEYHGAVTDIGLTANERERHMFVVGGTGNGKTTMLKYAIIQDMRAGKGVAVIDPHGDLAQELLAYVPPERVDDVIYFNPSDLSYPVGLNLLELPSDLTGDALLDAKDFITETVVSIMRKTFSEDGTGGHRIEYVLRNAVLTALTIPDATIFTVYELLTNSKLRNAVVKTLEQDWLRDFWKHEFAAAGAYQKVKMMSGVTAKIGRYHASVSASRILSQPKSTINFDEILNGKILICNLAKGLIGEDTSEVLGISVLAKLQLAAYARIKEQREARQPYYVYVDEFQNFATVSFVEMLSEARKYKLFLTMAEQTTAQQDDEHMVNTILTNAGTIVCFKSNSLADEQQLLHVFNGLVEPGEIANLPTYHFYVKLPGGNNPEDPTSGVTLLPKDAGDPEVAQAVIAASRRNYGVEWRTIEQAQAEVKAAKEAKAAAEAAARKKRAAQRKTAQAKTKQAEPKETSRERLRSRHKRVAAKT